MGTKNRVACHICNRPTVEYFRSLILGKYDAPYQYCEACDHVFVEDPFWLNEAYSDAIVAADTDIVVRNIRTALRLAAIFHFGFGERGTGKYADAAGGYGLLTRLMRDLGFDYYWSDPYAQNLFARGFEYDTKREPCSAISAIEVLEHVADPVHFIQECLTNFQTDTIAFTTETFPDKRPPLAKDWYYYAPETGQHIAFFSSHGLQTLASRLGLRYIRLGRIHLFTRKTPSHFKLKFATNNALVLPMALAAVKRLGSKRGADQALLMKAARSAWSKSS